jgi:hypothetical protein
MRTIIVTLAILVIPFIGYSQAPQFAVVRPDGTTYICPTWDSAYSKSLNGDNIYLPGGTFSLGNSLNKRLFIYGAGHSPDSSITTGKTSCSGNINIDVGAAGGSIEGVNLSNGGFTFGTTDNTKLNGYTIRRCKAEYVVLYSSIYMPVDSTPVNILVTECVLSNINCLSGASSGNFFYKNLIRSQIVHPKFCYIKNNTFLYDGYTLTGNMSNCTVENNIFLSGTPIYSQTGCTNNYYNNLKLAVNILLLGCPPNSGGIEIGTISVPSVTDFFVSFAPNYSNYPYADNYELSPACTGNNAGTDGTDVGIYGTSSPTPKGWVPSNPHIYFKQIAPQTNSNGQLQIQFKVRTGN